MGCHFLLQCMKVESEVAQSCPTFSDPMDCSLPGSSIHGFSRQEYWSGMPFPNKAQAIPSQIMSLLCFCLFSLSLFSSSCWWKVKMKVAQSCVTLWDPIDCSPPGSSAHGILQARILERVAFPFSSRSSQPRDQTQLSHITGRFLTS